MKLKFLPILAISTLMIMPMACKKKGCTDEDAINYDAKAKKDDGSCEYAEDNSYTVPAKYEFTDENGNNTVSFSGQKDRLDMLSEMTTYMKSANTAGTHLDAQQLKDMYANNSYNWTSVSGSTKQLKDKTAYGSANGSADAGIQGMFEDYMDSIAKISQMTTTGNEDGTSGVSGVWPNDGVKGPYLMSGDGVEYAQLIEKGLMAAVFMSQATVHYLGTIGDDDNTAAVDASNGKYYTEMEHHWDEAYGYFTSEIDFPTNGTDRFWGKYAAGREDLLGSATKIAEAFRTGRAAISNEDYTTRDEQVTIIRNEMEKVCAATAIHYLNDAKTYISDNTARNHVLSEAYAFIDGLRYGHNGINGVNMTSSDIDQALNYIGTDFNNITLANIDNAIDLISSKIGLDDVKASL